MHSEDKQNTQMCMFHKMRVNQWQSTKQLCLPWHHINGGRGATCSTTTGWPSTSDTHDGGSQQGKGEMTSQPGHDTAIGLVPFGGEEGSESFVGGGRSCMFMILRFSQFASYLDPMIGSQKVLWLLYSWSQTTLQMTISVLKHGKFLLTLDKG